MSLDLYQGVVVWLRQNRSMKISSDIKEIILRHDRPVPRYTSYPTAPHFKPGLTDSDYRSWLATITPSDPISLYLHVPFCKSMCWFCGCNTKVTQKYSPVQDYVSYLLSEIELLSAALPGRMAISHLHFGGGSPTMLSADDFTAILNLIVNRFDLIDTGERAIEIDPRNVNIEKIKAYAAHTITRVSFGVQDFDSRVLESINRPQPYELVSNVIHMCRDHGINAINLDFLYGLPHQTIDSMKKCAEQALTLNPDRISLFGYAHVPWMKSHMRLINEDHLPTASQRLDLFAEAAHVFESAGYIPIGIDHFARPDDSMAIAYKNRTLYRNFQGYTVDTAKTLLGIGASSISRFSDRYAQNCTAMPHYKERLNNKLLPADKMCCLSDDDQLYARIIEELMCYSTVNPYIIAGQLNRDPQHYNFDNAYIDLRRLEHDGLLTIDQDNTIHVSVRHAVRLACACFDQYLPKASHHDAPIKRHVSTT